MATSPASVLPLTNADAIAAAIVDTTGTQIPGFDSSRPATATITSVPSAVTSTTLLAANPARRRFSIFNESSKVLLVAFAATASATAYTYHVPANTQLDGVLNDYTGIITGIWLAANGNARVTEITT